MLPLLESFTWVHRRVETVLILDETTLRRTTSIDFTTPSAPAARSESTSARRPGVTEAHENVPLVFVSKRSEISRIDVRDAQGSSIPLLNRNLARMLGGAALIELAQQRIRSELRGASLSRALATRIAHAALRSSEREGLAEARTILTGRDGRGRDVYDVLYPDRRIGAILRHDQRFLDLLGWLAGCEPLVADVRRDPQPRILKVGFDETLGRGERHRLNRVRAAIGFRSPTLSTSEADLGNAVEFHVQVFAPPGVSVLEVTLRGGPPRTFLDPAPERRSPFPLRAEPSNAVTSAAHLFGDPPPSPNIGVLGIRVQAEPENAAASALVSTGTAGLLWAFALSSDVVVGRTESAAAILLVVPAIGAAFILRAEHPMVASLISGIRKLVAGAALLAVIAATALVVLPTTGEADHPTPSPLLDDVLVATATGATVVALIALWAWATAILRSDEARGG